MAKKPQRRLLGNRGGSSKPAPPSSVIDLATDPLPTRKERRGPRISRIIHNMMEDGVSLEDLCALVKIEPGETSPEYRIITSLLPADKRSRREPEVQWKYVVAALRIVEAIKSRDPDKLDRLLDRIEGRVPQRVHVAPDDEPEDIPELPDDTLARIAQGGGE